MKKVSIISACTDLGLKIDGAELGAQVLTNDLKSSNISHNYVLKGNKKDEESNSSSDSNDINSFVSKFDDLLLDMHEIHFEENMNDEEKDAYYTKMHNLVLAVKALDSKNEKRNLEGINEFNERLYNTTRKVIQDGEFPLLVGGDHIVAIGSSLGSIKENKNMGIIWFDSHADFNTYPVTVFSTEDIKKYGVEEICKKAFAIASNGTDGVHISFDLDLIDPNVAPGVSIPAKNGINLEEAYALADEITKYSDIIKSADLVEYNPLFDKDNVTKEIATNILNKWIEKF